MSSAEILAQLPKLNAEERQQLLLRLCELEDADLLQGASPTEQERRILDAALAAFERDGDPGTPWRESLARLRTQRPTGQAS